jgi:hypothetical protein
MGTYLATGIVHTVYIRKRDMGTNKFTIENIMKSLEKELNMDHYVFGKDEDSIFWEIKPKILEGNFSEFLETQFKMYDDTMDVQELITKVKEAKSGEEIIELAKSENFADFKMVNYIQEYPRVLCVNGFTDHLPVNYYLMAFFMDGKIIMECYGKIFHYFEKNIRLQEDKYPVAGCLKTMISG